MKQTLPLHFLRRVLPLGAVALLCAASPLTAEVSSPVAPRITQRIDDAKRTTLHGNTLPIAKPKYDKGAVDPSTPTKRMLLVLKRSDAQEADLKQLINDQHNPASPSFHKWLTPAEFGKRFGVADSDVQAITGWLQAKGFTINKVNQGKNVIDIGGTAGLLKSAFHTEMHTYERNGVVFHANNKDPEIPQALSGVVAGFASLNDFKPKSDLKVMGTAQYDPKTKKVTPDWSYPSNGGVYLTTAPGDLAVQYNIQSVYNSGTNGYGETIGILSASNVDVSIVQNYRSLFNIGHTSNLPQVIVDGDDPGQNGAAVEAYLDVEASGSMAPQAAVDLYVAADTITTSGLIAAIVRAVDDDVADVMSLSYGECEMALGLSGNNFFYYSWQQAAAQGQSVFVSAGDGGSAGCDDFDTESAAMDGLAVSGFTSTPYNTSVGGTDFFYSFWYEGPAGPDLNAQIAQYWNLNPQPNPGTSILSTIPEQPWNNSLGLNVLGEYGENDTIVAGSGGASSCVVGVVDPNTGSYDSCTSGYPKPSWQTGNGVPDDGVRDVPDVSLFAANGINFSFWPICTAGTDCVAAYGVPGGPVNITGVGGTSASSPATAGIMALIDQSQKGRQGNANFYFYAIAAQDADAFNDVTNGSNNVVCVPDSPNCSLDTNGDGFYTLQEYPATAGYDQASGLGTLNVAELISDWSKVTFTPTTTTLALSTTTVTHGTPITANVTVAGNGTAVTRNGKKKDDSGPGGSVALVTSLSGPNAKGQGTIAVTDGAGSASNVILPGGSYSVTGAYSGDGVFAASDSSAVSVTISPEGSTATITALEFDPNIGYNPVVPGGSYTVGDEFLIDADIAGASGFGVASGAVTFFDGSTAIGSGNVNTGGVAELSTASLAPGSHSITAQYGGDGSFNSSTSTALAFTIGKGTPSVFSEDSSFIAPVYAGQSFTVPVIVLGNSAPTPNTALAPAPTGTVTVTLGSQTATATLASGAAYSTNVGVASVTFTGLTVGTDALNITYSGDNNYNTATSFPETINVVAATLAASATTLSLASGFPNVSANTGAVVNINVAPATSGGVTPTGGAVLFVNGVCVNGCNAYGLDANGNANGVFIPAANLFTGANSITAQYLGDVNYTGSSSAALSLTANVGDFSMNLSNQTLTFASGGSATDTITVASQNGMQGMVNFTCTPSITSMQCSVNPTGVTLTSDGAQYTATVTLNTHYAITNGNAALHIGKWLAGGGVVMALMFLGFPARRRTWGTLFLLLAVASIGFGAVGCGSSSPAPTGNGFNTPPGMYMVTISASNSGVVHQQSIAVNLQQAAQ